MSGHYVKLFGSILNSSVWCADGDTKLVFITLLLLADGDGCVWGAVPGIARQAGVSVASCRKALAFLGGSDPDSRTPDHDGRRILAIDGGWRVVNHRKYREMQTGGQRAEAERAKRYRERRASRDGRDAGVTSRDGRDASRSSRTEVEVEAEAEEERTKGQSALESKTTSVAPALETTGENGTGERSVNPLPSPASSGETPGNGSDRERFRAVVRDLSVKTTLPGMEKIR